MDDRDDLNRMSSEDTDLSQLRETSRRPSWWDRHGEGLLMSIRSRTAITVMLALTILLVLAVGFWLTT